MSAQDVVASSTIHKCASSNTCLWNPCFCNIICANGATGCSTQTRSITDTKCGRICNPVAHR